MLVSVEALRPGTTNLTVDAHADQPELLELSESCHFGRETATQLVMTEVENFEICNRRKQLDRLMKWGSCNNASTL